MLVQMFVEDPPYIRHARAARIDFIGLALLVLWVGSLHVMLDKGQEEDWLDSTFIRVLLVATLLAFPAFALWELRAKHPIVQLRILKDRNFLLGCAMITVVGAVMYGATALLPLFLQTLLGYPAFESGLAVSPRGIGSFVGMIIAGKLVSRVDNRWLLLAGLLGLGYSTYALGGLSLEIAPIDVIWPNVINGLATACIFVPLTTIALGMLRNEEMANATSIYNLLRNVGAAIGIAMMTTFLARQAQVHQTVLVSHMTPYDAVYQQQMHAVQAALTPQCGAYEAARKAQAVMDAQMARQAGLWAYVDDFRMLAVMALACVPGVFLLRRLHHSEGPRGP
jgi:DHA2 family multidrug resistance protein